MEIPLIYAIIFSYILFVAPGIGVVSNYSPYDMYVRLPFIKPIQLLIKLFKKTKNLNKMKTKYLFQALKFACLPTLSVLTLLFFGFFDIAKTIAFISSDSGWAITLRVLLVIVEAILIYIMYNHYEIEGDKKDKRDKAGISENEDGTPVDYSKSIYDLRRNWGSSDKYKYYTKSDDIILIERTPTNDLDIDTL